MTNPTLFIGQIAPDGASFDAWSNQNLLLSLEQGGIAWPSSCRNGTCRTCFSQLNRGAVHYQIEWPGLSAEEKAQGFILPCVAYPTTDVTLQISDF